MFISLAISFVLSALKEAVKNPDKKAALRTRMLEIAQWIQTVYGEEYAFKAVHDTKKTTQ